MKLTAANLEAIVLRRKQINRWQIILFLILICAIPASYYLGTHDSGETLYSPQGAGSPEADNLTLRRELADLRLAREVDAGAEEQLQQTIKKLHDQSAEISEELSFYRGLMAPSENQKGLRIEKLTLEENSDASKAEFRLMLTQITDRRDWVQGTVSIDVIGISEGMQQVLSLTDFNNEQAYPFKFKFRYFQDFSGILTMPEAFTPQQILVTAVSVGKKGKRLQQKFNWNDLTRKLGAG
ncbi:MAG: hypothetical protein KUG75_07220 [Pseudomonadales bacterium]|nr:hypothetical protein [Pseudomonadales bacterium]